MNIDNLYRNAEVYLEMSREKFDRNDFGSALSSAVKSYEHTRKLIQQIYSLKIAATKNEPAGTEISP